MAEPLNPFDSLRPLTPGGLERQRTADMLALQPNASFWVREAGLSGIRARRRLADRGIAVTPEDQRAIATQEIMAGAQKRLAELVKTGGLDPMDAQEQAIKETMQAFMQAGDFEAAQGLLPGLNQIRTYKDEQNKLRSEAAENLAQGQQALSAAALSDERTADIFTQRPGKMANTAAQTQERLAHARYWDRMPQAKAPGKGDGEGPTMSEKAQSDGMEVLRSTFTVYDTMHDLLQLVTQTPGVMSGAAGVQAGIQNRLAGLDAYFKSKGSNIGGFESLSTNPDDARASDGKSPKLIAAQKRQQVYKVADRLNVDRTLFESMVINAAYSIARANDPGGRLSNNDFDYALQMLGAVDDPVAAKAAFANLARQTKDKYTAWVRSIGKKNAETYFADQIADANASYEAFEALWGQLGEAPKKISPSNVAGQRPADIEEILQRRSQ